MKRRILSLLLVLSMLATAVMTVATSAADEETGYPDVPSTRWSAESIIYMTEKGMMNDTGSGKFEPTKTVNRAMVVTVLYRMAGSPSVTGKTAFTDVETDKWYSDAVVWGSKQSIVTGFSDNTFRPMDSVTREQLVTFIGRFATLNSIAIVGTELTAFTDSGKIKDYALDYFKWAVKIGLVNGVTETEIRPTAGATREQFAAIMHRFDTNESFDYELVYNEPITQSQYTEKDYPLRNDADFFVSTTGNDANDGKTIATAFATFERAKEAVREFKKTATDEIVVAFMAGNYGYLDNITFTAEDGGTEEVPITYCAYGDGDVIFTNGALIENEEFKPIDESDYGFFQEKYYDGIYKVYIGDRIEKVGQYTTLFSGSEICWEARYPNKKSGVDQYFSGMTTRVDQFSSIEIQSLAKKTVDKFVSTEGMKVTGLLRTGWLTDTFLVESYDPETGIMVFDFDNPDFYPWGEYPMRKWDDTPEDDFGYEDELYYVYGDRGSYVLGYEERFEDDVFFHNVCDQLDQQGEYWVDTNTMTLYVYEPDGDYGFSDGGTLMTVETGADHISFIALEFNGSTDVAVYSNADYITYDLCRFVNISGSYALKASGVHNFTVSNCEFSKFGAEGLSYSSDTDRMNLVCGNNKVYNNYFHDFGFKDYWKNGMSFENDVGAVISHNLFENGAHGGIRFNTSMLCDIEYNVFDGMMTSTSDFGCVYTWNSSVFRGNNIRYNLFKNMDGGEKYAVYLDEMTHGQNVYGNIFYKTADGTVVMNGGRDNCVYDNVIIDNNGSGMSSSAKLYGYYEGGRTDTFTDSIWIYYGFQLPTEGTEAYEKWYALWPIMFNYHTDITRINEPECIFSNYNYYTNNYFIGCEFLRDDPTIRFNICGVFDGNVEIGMDENPLFVNPTLGDYRIREDADFPDLHFEMMGRE